MSRIHPGSGEEKSRGGCRKHLQDSRPNCGGGPSLPKYCKQTSPGVNLHCPRPYTCPVRRGQRGSLFFLLELTGEAIILLLGLKANAKLWQNINKISENLIWQVNYHLGRQCQSQARPYLPLDRHMFRFASLNSSDGSSLRHAAPQRLISDYICRSNKSGILGAAPSRSLVTVRYLSLGIPL